MVNEYFDRSVFRKGPIPSSQMCCARVLPPPVSVRCPLVFVLYPHVMLLTPISTHGFSPFTLWAGNVRFSLLQTRWRWGHSFSLLSGSKTTKWASQRALLIYLGTLGGELLPAAPLQPCAEAPLGRGHIVTLLDWINLAQGHYASNYACLAIQAWGTPSASCWGPSSGGPYRRWVLSVPCQYIPCPSFMPKSCLLSFIAHQSIKRKLETFHFDRKFIANRITAIRLN